MDKREWVLLNNGPSEAVIRKKKLMNAGRVGLQNIVDVICCLEEDEYFIIPKNQMIFPFSYPYREMTGREFKKRGLQFDLQTYKRTVDDMIEERATPHKLIFDAFERVKSGVDLDEDDPEECKFEFDKILRRGFKWDNRFKLHALMTQRDLMRAWRLTSLIITEDMDLAYSNPGNIFLIEVPSQTKDPFKNKYGVKIYNFALDLPSGYADWVDLSGQETMVEGFNKEIRGIDIYSATSLRYKIDEFRLTPKLLAAAILRAHYTDDRSAKGKFKNVKRVPNQEIMPVKINVPIPPTPKMINFDWKLDHNVVIAYETGSDEEIKLKKLNASEREVLYCVFMFNKGIENCYYRDDELLSLDEVVANFQKHYKN